MFTRSACARLGLSAVLAITLGGAAIAAQGNGGKGTQAVGTMQIASQGGASSPIYGFGFAVTNTGSGGVGGGGGAGKASLTAVEVTRLPDGASSQLFRNAVLGVHLQSVEFVVVGAGKSIPNATYTLEDVFVSGFSTVDGVERVAFTYGSIEVEVGGTKFCFSVKENASC